MNREEYEEKYGTEEFCQIHGQNLCECNTCYECNTMFEEEPEHDFFYNVYCTECSDDIIKCHSCLEPYHSYSEYLFGNSCLLCIQEFINNDSVEFTQAVIDIRKQDKININRRQKKYE